MLGWLKTHGPIWGLLAVSGFLRAFRLDEVAGQTIGDESWYVQDMRVILGLPLPNLKSLPAHPLSGLDPNSEHPPLVKLIMAAFTSVLGPTETSWRLPSVLLGTLGIGLLYVIVLRLGATRRIAWFAAFVLAFDNLSFIHGRIAMLDIYLSSFILLGTWLYLASWYELAGIAFGIAALCKINGLLGLFAMYLFNLAIGFRAVWKGSFRATWPALRPTWAMLAPRVSALGFCVAFFLAGLGTMDNYWTEFTGPLNHIAHMVSYHTGLTHHGPSTGSESMPFQWWLNKGAFDYFTWTWSANGKTNNVLFHAAMNEYVIWAAPMALFYSGQRAWADRSRLATFAVASFVANFGPPFMAWVIFSRMSYIFYMVPSIPAFACAIAATAEKVPRSVLWCFAGAMLFAFFYSFPFRYFAF